MLKELKDDRDFARYLERKIVIVDFSASWCNPCQILNKWLQKMEDESLLKDVLVLAVNIEHHQELSEKYDVQSVPTLIMFVKGVQKKHMFGIVDYNHAKTEVQKWIASVK